MDEASVQGYRSCEETTTDTRQETLRSTATSPSSETQSEADPTRRLRPTEVQQRVSFRSSNSTTLRKFYSVETEV